MTLPCICDLAMYDRSRPVDRLLLLLPESPWVQETFVFSSYGMMRYATVSTKSTASTALLLASLFGLCFGYAAVVRERSTPGSEASCCE